MLSMASYRSATETKSSVMLQVWQLQHTGWHTILRQVLFRRNCTRQDLQRQPGQVYLRCFGWCDSRVPEVWQGRGRLGRCAAVGLPVASHRGKPCHVPSLSSLCSHSTWNADMLCSQPDWLRCIMYSGATDIQRPGSVHAQIVAYQCQVSVCACCSLHRRRQTARFAGLS